MKPAAFAFRAPRTLEGVLSEMAQHGEEARILAGGQSLVPLMNLRMLQPAVLVSINDCAELSYVRAEEGGLVCGALARQLDVERSAEAQARCPLLVQALQHVGGRSNRNRGTVCGSLAHADPLAELPTVALALDAVMVANGPQGRREIAAADFFEGALANALAPEEILEAVRFPWQPEGAASCFLESGNRRHGFALAGVAVELVLDEAGRCRRARIAVMGGENLPLRCRESENRLLGARLDAAAVAEAGALAAGALETAGDFHADRAYRQALVATLLERALAGLAAEPGRKR